MPTTHVCRHPDILTTGDVARHTRMSQQTVIKACRKGSLKFFLVPHSTHRRIKVADAQAWAKNLGLPWEELT